MFEIREIKPDEHDFLREMLYEAIYFADENARLPKTIVNKPPLSKYIDKFGRRGDFALVLINENKLVGAVWSRLFTENEKSYGFIDERTPELSIAVLEKFRKRGFGGLMIQKLSEKLKSENFGQISLSVDKQNRAVNLYLRLGFEVVTEKGTAFTMLKKL